ncbi:hypothetical protein LJC06_02465 [Bacteroidales bacterium OttesenSCG-928-I14]|nr:hypothetical protein [Bacteroidales bacterium OttesenSCG-928-I14]
MSVLYVVQPRMNPQDREAPIKFYLIAKSWDHIDRKTLLKDMVRHTSLTEHEAAAGIDYLFEAIPNYLRLGLTVHLGELGYFKCTIRSKGVDTIDEATPNTIKSINLKFVPGNRIRKEVRNLPVEKFPEE